MISSVNLPLCAGVLAEYGGAEGLRRELSALGLDGVEGIWGGEDIPADFPPALLAGVPPTFDFLVENQWWPGFTFTDPEKTQRLLDRITYPRTGILLDTGHLMNTDPRLRTQAEGLAYLHEMLTRHGALGKRILGVHLHQSLSGAYVRRRTGQLPEEWPEDPFQRFAVSYPHIQKIDRHRPWTNPGVADLLDRIAPRYLTHELAAGDRHTRFQQVRRQQNTLQKGTRGEKQVN